MIKMCSKFWVYKITNPPPPPLEEWKGEILPLWSFGPWHIIMIMGSTNLKDLIYNYKQIGKTW